LIVSACNPTKYVKEGETLLNDNHVSVNHEGIKKSELLPYIKQKPNKRIFGARFHLGLYNLSNINKDKWPNKWLRDIGEEPVLYDPSITEKSRQNIKSFIASKGYFDSKVSDTVKSSGKKSDVYYNINLLPVYKVRNIIYEVADTNIMKLVTFDSVDCVIERGKPYNVDVLQAEISRFLRIVRDQGFYDFTSDNIYFKVDSTIGKRQVDIYYCVKNLTKLDDSNRLTVVPHSVHRVRNIYIYTDYIPKDALEGGEAYLKSLDTTNYKGYYFISPKGRPGIKYDLIIQSLYLKPGSVYNMTNTEQSQSHLLSLKTYRLVNISYNDLNERVEGDFPEMLLDCTIQLTMLSQQSFNIELEGTNSAGNLGGAVNLIYQHKNLLRGAELFTMKLKAAYETYTQPDSTLSGSREYGFETSLRLPKFMVPFLKTEGFIKKYNPSTIILGSFDYQALPFYKRTMAQATFGYDWKAGKYQEHIVNPIQVNIVKLLSIDPAFARRIDSSSYLAYSYKDVMILGGSYSYIFDNQQIKKSKDFWFMRINAETAGNMLRLAGKLVGAKRTDSTYNILGQPYAQYFRADLDLRYNYILNEVSSIVYRGFIGIGIPYGNSKALPFEKQYFSGGSNGLRAWQVRSLGPGSYIPRTTTFLNQTGDIKLEANAEYRYKLFWILEGALFLEAGNIWTFYDDKSRQGTQFRFNKFYRDIAVGTGTGLRFDLKFVIGRIDLGMKLRNPCDPTLADGSKWIFTRRPYNFRRDFAIVLGIGYPF